MKEKFEATGAAICADCDSPDLDFKVADDGVVKFKCNECGCKEIKLADKK
jgi:hypothetical protein